VSFVDWPIVEGSAYTLGLVFRSRDNCLPPGLANVLHDMLADRMQVVLVSDPPIDVDFDESKFPAAIGGLGEIIRRCKRAGRHPITES
jgi:hypothetical protein